jgi:hypothetical protein
MNGPGIEARGIVKTPAQEKPLPLPHSVTQAQQLPKGFRGSSGAGL